LANEPPEAISDRAVRPVAPTSGNDLSATAAQMLACDREALAALIGEKHYLMGDKPCGSDAFVFGIVTSILTPSLDIPPRAGNAEACQSSRLSRSHDASCSPNWQIVERRSQSPDRRPGSDPARF
jgi:hypothetical protein